MAAKPEYVLFYMNGDKFCNSFLKKIKGKSDLLKKINMVDIDAVPAIPDEVDMVPCIYDGKTIFKGKDAFTWFDDISINFLSAADDGLMYSFLDGQDEQVFNNYSLLEQRNGSFGMGDSKGDDPTRMSKLNINDDKNRSMESLMAMRNQDVENTGKANLNKLS